jgi:hypothetical protein
MQSGNNEEYIDLVFERIDDASVLSNFYCGIPDMDDFIHEKLEAYKTKDYSAVGFYNRCRFIAAELPLGYKDTLRMYKVLHPIHRQEDFQ